MKISQLEKSDRDFHFIACKKLMFETGRETSELDAFPAAVKHTSRESFFLPLYRRKKKIT